MNRIMFVPDQSFKAAVGPAVNAGQGDDIFCEAAGAVQQQLVRLTERQHRRGQGASENDACCTCSASAKIRNVRSASAFRIERGGNSP
jgi:hypothetical protein